MRAVVIISLLAATALAGGLVLARIAKAVPTPAGQDLDKPAGIRTVLIENAEPQVYSTELSLWLLMNPLPTGPAPSWKDRVSYSWPPGWKQEK
jgi:hypothetical protein